VIVCHTTADGERLIDLAQVDLVTHLAQRLGPATTQRLHARLAQYFAEPIADDIGSSLDDRYSRAKAAARHWANADRPRHAADAERVAAGLAEQTLAYQEARDHYKRAIRLFTQLLARNARKETVSLDDHEDLLILANCLYRLGQMTRLANERRSGPGKDPTKYFHQALKRLQELSTNLHDRRLAAPQPADPAAVSPRDLPKPNIIRHHIRLCEALSGWINLELAEWHELRGESQRSRELLFDTLRHAEAARGEADSRWLLAAASVRLAQQLVNDAVELRFDHPIRAHNLIIEALFQVERVIGLQAVSPEEERNLEDPRSRAWMVLGQILQTMEVEPRLAEWALRRMNEHRRDVSDLVDMMTDRQLGLFLLSRAHRTADDPTAKSEARTLLERHARWATESGLDREHSAAFISLALLELVEQADAERPDLAAAWSYVDRAIEHSPDPRLSENAGLLRGVLRAIAERDTSGTAFHDSGVVAEFRAALRLPTSAEDGEVLRTGWTTTLVRLLRICPHLKHELGLTAAFTDRQPSELFDALALDRQLEQTFDQADAYLDALDSDGPLVPSNDRAIWKLLRWRVAGECFRHAEMARDLALELLRIHFVESDLDDIMPLLERDLEYGVAVHEWYRSTDPSRLLTLARESNMSIDGAEWASPKLLSGRLAIQVLDRQYRASAEIGHERFARISSMVTNWATACDDAGPLEQMVFVALQMSEPFSGTPAWHRLAREPGQLAAAYAAAVAERSDQVRQAGLPIVQDLHLADAEMAATATHTDERGDDA